MEAFGVSDSSFSIVAAFFLLPSVSKMNKPMRKKVPETCAVV